jgi:hypothetical protein
MANFPRIRLPGFWVLGSVVDPAEFEAIDAIRPMLINAADGSTHAPTDPIVIGGDGLQVTGPLSASGNVTITGGGTTDITMSGTTRVKLGSRSITRIQPFFFHSSDAASWTINEYGFATQIDNDDLVATTCPVRPPHGSILTSVSVILRGAAGHAGLPGTMPHIWLTRVPDTGSPVDIGNQADPTNVLATYESTHGVTISGLSETINRATGRYVIRVYGEKGANTSSPANLKVYHVHCTYTPETYDED